jgi:hypothetical protein
VQALHIGKRKATLLPQAAKIWLFSSNHFFLLKIRK